MGVVSNAVINMGTSVGRVGIGLSQGATAGACGLVG